jgi:hypothetical protein
MPDDPQSSRSINPRATCYTEAMSQARRRWPLPRPPPIRGHAANGARCAPYSLRITISLVLRLSYERKGKQRCLDELRHGRPRLTASPPLLALTLATPGATPEGFEDRSPGVRTLGRVSVPFRRERRWRGPRAGTGACPYVGIPLGRTRDIRLKRKRGRLTNETAPDRKRWAYKKSGYGAG